MQNLLCHIVFLVLQLRAVRPAYGNRTARNRQPESPQLENEVLHPAFLHYTCCKTTKPMSYSDIKPQSLERSALEKQRFLTAVNKFRFT